MSPDSSSPNPRFRRREVLSLSAASVATALAGCSYLPSRDEGPDFEPPERTIPADWKPNPGDWPVWGYDYANTRHNPFSTPPRENPGVAWTFDEPADSIVVGDGRVFVRNDTALVALDAATGQEHWRTQRDELGSVSFIEGRLYDLSRTTLVAFDSAGTEEWSKDVTEFLHTDVIEREGYVYVLSRDRFACLHTDTGEVLVETELDDVSHYSPATAGGRIFSGDESCYISKMHDCSLDVTWAAERYPYRLYGAMALSDGLLFRPEFALRGTDVKRGRLSILDATDGRQRTDVTFDTVPRGPAVNDGTVFVSTSTVRAGNIGDDGKLIALTYDGETQWEYTPEASLQPPAIANDTVYTAPFANQDAPLIAFDANSGEELWRKEPTSGEVGGDADFAIAGDTLYVADGNRVSAFRN